MKTFTFLALGALTISVTLRADDFASARLHNWHHWRGPGADGVAPHGDPPVEWDGERNIRWKVDVPGKGRSTPIVWGDQVFVLTVVKTGRVDEALPEADEQPDRPFGIKFPRNFYRFVVMSFDRKSGKLRWRRTASEQVPHEGHHPTNDYASGSPTTDGRFLYASFGSRGIYCYDLDGKPRWERDLGDMQTRRSFGEGSSPVVHGDTLIVNWDHDGPSRIFALDARTGRTRWEREREEKTTWNTPLILEREGRTQVIVSATNRVRSYDLKTGEVIWECAGQTVNVIPSPVAIDDLVICMSGYRGNTVHAISLAAKGDISGTDMIAWKHDRGAPYVPSPLLYGGSLYFTQSNVARLSCLEARTGKVRLDRQRLPGLHNIYASPAGAADRIYIVGRDGTTLVIRRTADLEVLATNPIDEPMDASPAIVGRDLFLRGRDHLYCIGRRGS